MRLQYTDMPQIIQFLADIHAQSPRKEKQAVLSSLEPSKTTLFFGVNEAPECSMLKREQYRGQVRRALKKLLIAILKIVNTHLDGRFSACLCPKILKYTKYSCDFGASTVEKSARRSAYRQF